MELEKLPMSRGGQCFDFSLIAHRVGRSDVGPAWSPVFNEDTSPCEGSSLRKRGNEIAAFQCFLDGKYQVYLHTILHHVAQPTCSLCRSKDIGILMNGEEDNRSFRPRPSHLLGRIDPTHYWHRDVENYNIRMELLLGLHRSLAIGGCSDDCEL
jgi:hypothetical protein